jgi:hypothetical protein
MGGEDMCKLKRGLYDDSTDELLELQFFVTVTANNTMSTQKRNWGVMSLEALAPFKLSDNFEVFCTG